VNAKPHVFEPRVVQVRRQGDQIIRTAHCRTCGKPGREQSRTGKNGRVVTYWQHRERPVMEPVPKDACDWQGTGRIWCCKEQGHSGGHHAHRGPRRNVYDAP